MDPKMTCDAFPEGIPDDILWNKFDHRKPHDGDHGVRYELGTPHDEDKLAAEYKEHLKANPHKMHNS
jgi:hypothetical protein